MRVLKATILGIRTIRKTVKYSSNRVATGIPRAQTEIRRLTNGSQLVKLPATSLFNSDSSMPLEEHFQFSLFKYQENKRIPLFLIIEKIMLLPAAISVYPVEILKKDIIEGICPNPTITMEIPIEIHINFLLHLCFAIGNNRIHIMALRWNRKDAIKTPITNRMHLFLFRESKETSTIDKANTCRNKFM